MKYTNLLITMFTAMILIGCSKDPASNKEDTKIRMAIKEDDLTYLIEIEFLALAKDNSLFSLSREEILNYNKYNADWYIDGNFNESGKIDNDDYLLTYYKDFNLSLGSYFYLLRTRRFTVTGGPSNPLFVKDGNNTVHISRSGIPEMDQP